MPAKQLGFPFAQRIRYNPQDFLVTSSNKLAYSWIEQWPQWPSHALLLWGSVGCGKTHLAHVWQQKLCEKNIIAHWMTLKDLADFPLSRIVILENLDEAIAQHPKEVFHLYNIIKEQKGFLLCTAKTSPAQWKISLADLSSRILSIPSVQIMPPDDDLLRGILHKRFSDLQLHTPPQVIEYIIKNTERSFESLQSVVDKIATHLQNLGGNLSIPLIKKILAV